MKVLVETYKGIPKVFKAQKDTYKQIKKRLYKVSKEWGYNIRPDYQKDEVTDLATLGQVFFKSYPRRKDGAPESEIHLNGTEGLAILKPTYVSYHWHIVDIIDI